MDYKKLSRIADSVKVKSKTLKVIDGRVVPEDALDDSWTSLQKEFLRKLRHGSKPQEIKISEDLSDKEFEEINNILATNLFKRATSKGNGVYEVKYLTDSSKKVQDGFNPSSEYRDPRFGDDNKDYRKLLSSIKSAARKCGGWLRSWNSGAGWIAYFPDEASADKYAELCASMGFPAFGKKDTGHHYDGMNIGGIEVVLAGSWTPGSWDDYMNNGSYTLYSGEASHESNLPETGHDVHDLMLKDLKKKLDSGKVLYFSGADRPGEHVTYCNRANLEECVTDLAEENDMEGSFEELCEEMGVNPDHKYFRLALDWNDTGDWYSTSGDSVEELDPAMDDCVEIMEEAIEKGTIKPEQVVFCDDNEEFPFEDMEEL